MIIRKHNAAKTPTNSRKEHCAAQPFIASLPCTHSRASHHCRKQQSKSAHENKREKEYKVSFGLIARLQIQHTLLCEIIEIEPKANKRDQPPFPMTEKQAPSGDF